MNEEPVQVDTGPKKIDINTNAPEGEKPAWVLEKEKQKAELEAEKKRQAEIEAQMNDPERKAALAQLEADLKQLDYLEAEQRSLKLSAQQGQATGAANSKKIEDLQKQIDDLKAAVETKKKASAAPGKKKNGEAVDGNDNAIEVVKGNDGAKQAALGFLTMRTINPSAANVLLNGDSLGSTPFSKVPLEAGVHKLIVMDGDGRSRVLSVTVTAGKTVDMNGIDVSSLPFAK
ncbi:MAG: PEGA domain-containing protein [Archangium sp.]